MAGGDRRSTGCSDKIAQQVLDQPARIEELMAGLTVEDAVVRGRTAHALMLISGNNPRIIQPFKDHLMHVMETYNQWELRFELSKSITGLELDDEDVHRCIRIFQTYLDAPQSFVKTGALQGMADLARYPSAPKDEIRKLLGHYAMAGTAAMRARCRKLLKRDW